MSVSSIGSYSAYGSLFMDTGSGGSLPSTGSSSQAAGGGALQNTATGEVAAGTGVGSTGALLSTIASTPSIASSTGTNWLTEAQSAESATDGGLLGMLSNSSGGSSISSFLSDSQSNADAFANITQSSTTATSQFAQQEAQANAQAQTQQNQLNALLNPPGTQDNTNFTPDVTLDPNIYFPDGSSLDTVGNILTRNDGTQVDITTGLQVLNPQTTLMLANGAYIDTAANVLHESNGQAIDMYTGLPESYTSAVVTSDTTAAESSSTDPGSTVSVTA